MDAFYIIGTGCTLFCVVLSTRKASFNILLPIALLVTVWLYLNGTVSKGETPNLAVFSFYLWLNYLLLHAGCILSKQNKNAFLTIINTLIFYVLYRLTQPTLEPSGLLACLVACIQLASYHYIGNRDNHKSNAHFFWLFLIFLPLGTVDLFNDGLLMGILIIETICLSLCFKHRSRTAISILLMVILVSFFSIPFQISPAASWTNSIPILYSPRYNLSLGGIEKLHPFDTHRYERVFNILGENGLISQEQAIRPGLPTEDELRLVHSEQYLKNLNTAGTLARISELGFLALLPDKVARQAIAEPMLYATKGTMLAGESALKHGWAINLGGGYHHAYAEGGGGFCAFADISLSIKQLMQNNPKIKKVMIIDLDAHQGNGHERDFINSQAVFIVDMYNGSIYPQDEKAKQGADLKVELPSYTKDEVYLALLENTLKRTFREFQPDIIYYNAGTDLLEGDTLGRLSISPAGVIQRDEMVFKAALDKNIPIVMVLSGGYQKTDAEVIAHSIINLDKKFSLIKRARKVP